MALTFDDRISFVLNDQLQLKRIRFTDAVLDETEDADTAAQRFDADFAIMSLEFPLATLTRQQPNYSQMWTPIHDLERYYLGQVTHEEELATILLLH